MVAVQLLTIGAFAKAAGLSPKALRLYDELQLLTPASVDPGTGYRYYAVDQLERARLVAWLRRIGMPLSRIQRVCTLDAEQTAAEITAYWEQVEAEMAARRELADSLVHWLAEKPPGPGSLVVDYAVRSDTGLVRDLNQDAAYAGERLLAVADGFGSEGAPASAAAVQALRALEADPDLHLVQAADLLNALRNALDSANSEISRLESAEAGTTLTAMMWTGSKLALVHIGDSRAYVLRGRELYQITHDHSVVQFMVDEGRLTAEEAQSHPQRSLLVRALDGSTGRQVDAELHDVRPGERYLICSDGLTSIVSNDQIRTVLMDAGSADEAAGTLVAWARAEGAPDNVSCVVADLREVSR
jgi:serine/threonine protein phosphatase PrpC